MTKRPAFIVHTPSAPRELSRVGRTGEPLGLLADLATAADLRALRAYHEVLPPGRRSSSPHAHTTREEVVYVLAGCPDLWLDGVLYRLGPGDAVAFAAGTGVAHTLINHGPEAVALFVVASAPPDDACFYPHDPHDPAVPADIAREWAARPRGPHDGRAPAAASREP